MEFPLDRLRYRVLMDHHIDGFGADEALGHVQVAAELVAVGSP